MMNDILSTARKISGICMTGGFPADVVRGRDLYFDPEGARASLPVPLLFSHDADRQIGRVIEIEPKADGLHFTAIVDDLDAWKKLQDGGLRGVSVSAQPIEGDIIKKQGWIDVSEFALHEISTELGDQKNGRAIVTHVAPPLAAMRLPSGRSVKTRDDINEVGRLMFGNEIWAARLAELERLKIKQAERQQRDQVAA